MTKNIITVLVIVLTAVVLAGCGPGKKVIEKDGVKISSNEDGVTVESEDGNVQFAAGAMAKLPESFPEELVAVDDAKVVMSTTSDQGVSVAYTTNTEAKEMVVKIVEILEGTGWKRMAEVNTNEDKMLNYSKDKQNAVITIGDNTGNKDEGITMVTIVLVTE